MEQNILNLIEYLIWNSKRHMASRSVYLVNLDVYILELLHFIWILHLWCTYFNYSHLQSLLLCGYHASTTLQCNLFEIFN